jgi:hypothetical protein
MCTPNFCLLKEAFSSPGKQKCFYSRMTNTFEVMIIADTG